MLSRTRTLATSALVAATAMMTAPAGAAAGWQAAGALPASPSLYAVSFAGGTGYAAGDLGALAKTTDGGRTWTRLSTRTLARLTLVDAVDAKTVVAGGACVVRRSTDGGATFTPIAIAPHELHCANPLAGIAFRSAMDGDLLLRDGSLLATSDGGVHLTRRAPLPGTIATGGHATATALTFADASTGIAATDDGKLFRTTDDGDSWTLVASGRPPIAQIAFPDPAHGYAVGEHIVLRTDDGGRTWTPLDLGVGREDYTGVSCASAQTCLLTTAGFIGSTIVVRTTDGLHGKRIVPAHKRELRAVAFASSTQVVIVGDYGTVARSDDAGATFAPIGGQLTATYDQIVPGPRPRSAFAVSSDGFGRIAETTDGGRSWRPLRAPTDLIEQLTFPTRSTGYLVDANFRLFRTANDGRTWKRLHTGYPYETHGGRELDDSGPPTVYAPDARHVLLLGAHGARRSANGGRTWVRVRDRRVAHRSLSVAWATERSLIAADSAGLVRTDDDGRSWTRLRTPGSVRHVAMRTLARTIRLAIFATARIGFVVDGAGRLWRTSDAGRRWRQLPTVGSSDIESLGVGTAHDAYITIGDFGQRNVNGVLHSADEGATWQAEIVDSYDYPDVKQLASENRAADSFRDLLPSPALGGRDYLIATSTGEAESDVGSSAAAFTTTNGGIEGRPGTLTLAASRTRLAKADMIELHGRLQPARAGARVVLAALAPEKVHWKQQVIDLAADGSFTARWHVGRGTTTFAAHAFPDATTSGAGSRAVEVRVR